MRKHSSLASLHTNEKDRKVPGETLIIAIDQMMIDSDPFAIYCMILQNNINKK